MAMTRWGVIAIGLLVVVLLAPVWAAYGALVPGGHGGEHGGMVFDVDAFAAAAARYAAAHTLPDGSVMAVTGEPIPILAQQFGFTPRILKMRTGETYSLEIASKDVIHGFSLQAGLGSLNAVLVPGSMTPLEITPTQPGEYLVLCNEYCGLGHQVMSGRILVEGPPVDRDNLPTPTGSEDHRPNDHEAAPSAGTEPAMPGMAATPGGQIMPGSHSMPTEREVGK